MTPVSKRLGPLSVSIASLSALLAALLIGVVAAAPHAAAHDPIFISDDQTTPDVGPYMPDGTTSWALYGQVLEPADTRGFEFDLRDGDELYISLLIPNLSPEIDLGDAELPVIELESPSGEVRTLVPEVREVFDEPFSRTSYITLNELREPAEAGRYRGVVIGGAPARFTVAVGENEIFFTETERSGDRPSSFMEITAPLQVWYTTPPGGEAPEDLELDEGEAEIDLDMIEEAMDTGEGRIEGDGSIRGDEAGDEAAPADDTAAAGDDASSNPDADGADADSADADSADADSADADSADADAAATESAAAATDDESGGSNGWVAPVVIAAAAAVGVGLFATRRRNSEDA